MHDGARTHFFAAAEQITVRTWMKEIMKATILRDYSGASRSVLSSMPSLASAANLTLRFSLAAPVVSSCDIEVLPLETAKTMVPYPRPPSPARRAEIQKERCTSCRTLPLACPFDSTADSSLHAHADGGANPNTLSSKDAAILMDMSPCVLGLLFLDWIEFRAVARRADVLPSLAAARPS